MLCAAFVVGVGPADGPLLLHQDPLVLRPHNQRGGGGGDLYNRRPQPRPPPARRDADQRYRPHALRLRPLLCRSR
jgi:hypothetical protein